MTSGWTISRLLDTATQISSRLSFVHAFSSTANISIQFFEDVIHKLLGLKSDSSLPIESRFRCCLDAISKAIHIPLTHISPTDLHNSDPNALGNFLEILHFLVEYVSYRERSSALKLPSVQSSPMYTSNDDPKDTALSSCSSLVSVPDADGPGLSPATTKATESGRHSSESNKVDTASTKPNPVQLPTEDERMIYLRKKLQECLKYWPLAAPCSTPTIENQTPTPASPKAPTGAHSESTHSRRECGSTRNSGLVKPQCQLLRGMQASARRPFSASVVPVGMKANETAKTAFDKLLDAFPGLKLDEHYRRLFALKSDRRRPPLTGSLDHQANASNTKTTTWVEERQQRRLAQLMRHDLHLCRLQEQRATEEADRLVRAQIRERRYQLVRAHNYYRQFVQEFRRKKIAKVVEEEQVFRRFFEQMLMQEKEYLREIQKLEHDDRQAKISLLEQKLSGLEHCQQVRMSLMKEKLKEEHDRRVAAARDERLLLAQRKRELRKLLEMRIREMQQCLLSSHDSAYFRERDGERSVLHSSGFVY